MTISELKHLLYTVKKETGVEQLRKEALDLWAKLKAIHSKPA